MQETDAIDMAFEWLCIVVHILTLAIYIELICMAVELICYDLVILYPAGIIE
jgi:hypothetical protein